MHYLDVLAELSLADTSITPAAEYLAEAGKIPLDQSGLRPMSSLQEGELSSQVAGNSLLTNQPDEVGSSHP